MGKDHIFESYKDGTPDGMPFYYEGAFSHKIIAEYAEILDKHISANERLRQKVISVFIEMAQNIKLYSAKREYLESEVAEVGLGAIAIREEKDAFMLIAGNAIMTVNRKELLERCRMINSLQRQNLNTLYKKERNKAIKQGRMGGNIGLIELARRSRNPLDIGFDKIDDRRSYFTVEVTINKH